MAPPTPFTDIAGSPFKPDIEWVYTEGITSGCSPTLYCPDGVVTREQMATFFARTLGLSGPAPDAFTDDETSMQSPWSGYPGYTSVQVEDFNRAGEEALLLRASYSFPKVPGLSAYALWVNGSDPDSPTESARDEYDVNLQWSPAAGALKGLMFRLRYAYIDQDNGTDLSDFRLMVYYDPPKL